MILHNFQLSLDLLCSRCYNANYYKILGGILMITAAEARKKIETLNTKIGQEEKELCEKKSLVQLSNAKIHVGLIAFFPNLLKNG